jgi:hypothetical protein
MRYLIQIDGILYAYERPDILSCDIIIYKPSSYTLYERKQLFGKISYEPITLEQLHEQTLAMEARAVA